MSDDTAINRTSIKHAYQQVADAITARITGGYYATKLPSERALAEEFSVSYITATSPPGTPWPSSANAARSSASTAGYLRRSRANPNPPVSRAELAPPCHPEQRPRRRRCGLAAGSLT